MFLCFNVFMKILEGSNAIAQVVKLAKPAVVSAYPITPQTHIVEELAKMKSKEKVSYEFVRAESEFAACSIVLGASATGVRSYTATCSQGLLLMTEVVFTIAGLRLPVVMTCANRAVSAPINIWNDQQDSMTVRDSGWLFLYAETVQEAVDMHLLAFRLAETLQIPVMVNVDGFVITHTFEPVEIPSQELANKFLPAYKPDPKYILNVEKPISMGCFAAPDKYMELREELHQNLVDSQALIKKYSTEFKKVFGRNIGNNGLVEEYKLKDADLVLVSMGSVCGTIKEVIDEERKKGKKVGLLKIITFRPFPDLQIVKSLVKAKKIAVIEKAISMGTEGPLATDMKREAYTHKIKADIQSFVLGLGGRDISKQMIRNVINGMKKCKGDTCIFIGKEKQFEI